MSCLYLFLQLRFLVKKTKQKTNTFFNTCCQPTCIEKCVVGKLSDLENEVHQQD